MSTPLLRLPFRKYQGAGNDFVIVEERHLAPLPDVAALARFLCDRRKGVGADGLILLLPSKTADFRMRIFNADGSEPTMCGNGAYCLLHYIDAFLRPFNTLSLETAHAHLQAHKEDDKLLLNLGPLSIQHFPLSLEGHLCYVVHTGVPHAIFWVEDLERVDVLKEGRRWRFHSHFAPEGVNVNFVSLSPQGQLRIRTYERGVEGETLACGTGAAAAAFVAKQLHRLPEPISVATRSQLSCEEACYQSLLHFQFVAATGTTLALMQGASQFVFEGEIRTLPSKMRLRTLSPSSNRRQQ